MQGVSPGCLKCPAHSWNEGTSPLCSCPVHLHPCSDKPTRPQSAREASTEQVQGVCVGAGRTSSHPRLLCSWPSLTRFHVLSRLCSCLVLVIQAQLCSWTQMSTSALGHQEMPDTCYPGPCWCDTKTSHKHHKQNQTQNTLFPHSLPLKMPGPQALHRCCLPGDSLV